MTGQEGKWNFVDCKYAYSRVICKTEASEYQGCRLKKKGFLIPESAETSASVVMGGHHHFFLGADLQLCLPFYKPLTGCTRVSLRGRGDVSGAGGLHRGAHRRPSHRWLCDLQKEEELLLLHHPLWEDAGRRGQHQHRCGHGAVLNRPPQGVLVGLSCECPFFGIFFLFLIIYFFPPYWFTFVGCWGFVCLIVCCF